MESIPDNETIPRSILADRAMRKRRMAVDKCQVAYGKRLKESSIEEEIVRNVSSCDLNEEIDIARHSSEKTDSSYSRFYANVHYMACFRYIVYACYSMIFCFMYETDIAKQSSENMDYGSYSFHSILKNMVYVPVIMCAFFELLSNDFRCNVNIANQSSEKMGSRFFFYLQSILLIPPIIYCLCSEF